MMLYILSGVGVVAIIFAIWFGIDIAIEEKIHNETYIKIQEIQDHIKKIDQDITTLYIKIKEK